MRWLLAVVFGLLLAILVLFVGVLLYGIAEFLFPDRPWVLVAAAIALVALTGGWAHYHRDPDRSDEAVPHRGVLIHSIPVAGAMGLIFTLGYLVMFWFGLPGLRPVVLVLGAVGLVLGTFLIWLDKHRSVHAQQSLLHSRSDDTRP
jgi:hypothetical protein